ncbi:MAG: hypothetical protein ACREVQ_12870 [Burkholderiales bacterium]
MRPLAAALLLATLPAVAGDLDRALQVGDLICEFGAPGRPSLVADLVAAPRRADLLLVYESVTHDSAQVVSTRVPGRRPVQVRSTAKAVHFIEYDGPSVRVTTLTGCERRKWKGEEQICVRFRATHAWHFDMSAASDPDRAFERLPSGAASGECEPWQVD